MQSPHSVEPPTSPTPNVSGEAIFTNGSLLQNNHQDSSDTVATVSFPVVEPATTTGLLDNNKVNVQNGNDVFDRNAKRSRSPSPIPGDSFDAVSLKRQKPMGPIIFNSCSCKTLDSSSSNHLQIIQNQQTEEDSLIAAYQNDSYFVDINFLLSDRVPDDVVYKSVLQKTKLRPKEVSIIRVSGQPYARHWLIDYSSSEGVMCFNMNWSICQAVHGMLYDMTTDYACSFDDFFVIFKELVRGKKIYSMNPLVTYYVSEVLQLDIVQLQKRYIQFDPYIGECKDHVHSDNTHRCTMNRVWALRHSFSKELSSHF